MGLPCERIAGMIGRGAISDVKFGMSGQGARGCRVEVGEGCREEVVSCGLLSGNL